MIENQTPLAEPATATEAVAGSAPSGLQAARVPERPPWLPAKFWNPATGQPRVEALARSYAELERKLSQSVQLPRDGADEMERQRFHRALGVPEGPNSYQVATPLGAIVSDPLVNARLHEAGFTQPQVQLVYDLAEEVLSPMVSEVLTAAAHKVDSARLEDRFGGKRKWNEMRRQIARWGKANLPRPAYDNLACCYEGVLVLETMMKANEPSLLRGEGAADGVSEGGLREMMRDPRYWRDRDPAFVSRVTDGFKRLYPE